MNNWPELNQEAKKSFDNKDFYKAKTILNKPDIPEELIPNLAKCYYYTKEADIAYDLVKNLQPSHELNIDVSLYLSALGRFDESYQILSNLDTSDPKVRFNLGWHKIRLGNFLEGFDLLQSGSECRAWGNEYQYLETGVLSKEKRWDGQSKGKLAIILEGGIGDQIIFLRWVYYISQSNPVILYSNDNGLIRLLVNSGYKCRNINLISYVDYDYYVPSMSIPSICRITYTLDHVNFRRYIHSHVEPYIKYEIDILSGKNPKIGIKWKGNPMFEHDQMRTIPVNSLIKTIENAVPNAKLFSLQLDENIDLPNAGYLIKNWQDTYSFIMSLDLVITSCTSIAHLCGAIGKPCIVMVPLLPYFTWANKNGNNWYKENVVVIHQTKYNDWTEAFEKLDEKLKNIK